MTNTDTGTRIRKSERLSKDELKALKGFRKDFGTMEEFAEQVGVKRTTLNRIFLAESGNGASVTAIREYLAKKAGEREEANAGAQM